MHGSPIAKLWKSSLSYLLSLAGYSEFAEVHSSTSNLLIQSITSRRQCQAYVAPSGDRQFIVCQRNNAGQKRIVSARLNLDLTANEQWISHKPRRK